MSRMKREPSEDSIIYIGPRSEYVKKYPVHPLTKRENFKPPNEATRNDAPLDDVTINKQDYPPHAVEKRQSFKPSNETPRNDARLDSVTINKRDFPAHPVEKRSVIKPAPGNIVSEGGFDFTSSYNNQFIADRPAEKRKSFRPPNERQDLGAFDGEPSYKADYPEWRLPEKRVKEKIEWNPPDIPFGADTTNTTDFPVHQVSPRVDHRPNRGPVMSDQPFQANSDYKETFKAHDLPPKVQRERETWTKPTDPFDATTTAQRDFRGEYSLPTKSMRPDREPFRSDVAFDPNTTAGNAYKAHEMPKRYKHEPEVYKQPDGNMDLNTTNATQYQPHSVQRRVAQKPGSSDILKGKGPLTTETSYTNNFFGKRADRVPNMKPQNDYEPPTIPMDMNTINHNDFYKHQIPPRQSFKPKTEPTQYDPFDDSTSYNDKFKQHEISPRVPRPKEEYIGSTVPLDARTTAKDSYQGLYQPKRLAMNPDRTPLASDAAFDGTTTMNTDFKKVEIPQRYFRKPAEYQKPEGMMDLSTTNNVNYLPHSVSKHTINKPGSSGILKGNGEFSKTTNYSGDFFPRQIDRVKMLKPDSGYEPPTEPLDARTTNNLAFSEKERSKRQSFKPTSEIMKSNEPFDDRTDYRDRFVQHEVTARKFREKQIHEAPSVPLDTRTTAQDSFKGAMQNKRESFKPNEGYTRNEIPFEQSTTANASFKAWPTAPRYVHKANEYIKPEGNMDLTTSNRETYKDVKGERPAMNRLRSSNLLSYGGKFDSTTSYSGDYIQKPLEGRTRVKPNQEYVPSTVPFDSHTEYRSQLVGYVAPKEKSCKPTNALSDTLGQRDQGNKYHVRQPDWRDMLNMSTGTTTVS